MRILQECSYLAITRTRSATQDERTRQGSRLEVDCIQMHPASYRTQNCWLYSWRSQPLKHLALRSPSSPGFKLVQGRTRLLKTTGMLARRAAVDCERMYRPETVKRSLSPRLLSVAVEG